MPDRERLSIDAPMPELFWDVIDPRVWLRLLRQAGRRTGPNTKLGVLVMMWGHIIGLLALPISALGLDLIATLALFGMIFYAFASFVPLFRASFWSIFG